jgi:hypothetical protein
MVNIYIDIECVTIQPMEGVFVTTDYARRQLQAVADEDTIGVPIHPESFREPPAVTNWDFRDIFRRTPVVDNTDVPANLTTDIRTLNRYFANVDTEYNASNILITLNLDNRLNTLQPTTITLADLYVINSWRSYEDNKAMNNTLLLMTLDQTLDTTNTNIQPIKLLSRYIIICEYLRGFMDTLPYMVKGLEDYQNVLKQKWITWDVWYDMFRKAQKPYRVVGGSTVNGEEQLLQLILYVLQPEKTDVSYYTETVVNRALKNGSHLNADGWRADLEYAKLVKGALINVNLRVVWGSADPFASADTEARLSKQIWDSVKPYVSAFIKRKFELNPSLTTFTATEVAQEYVRARKLFSNILLEHNHFTVCKEVEMVEFEVIYRLSNDGVFPWLVNGKPTDGLDVITLVRALRWSSFKHQFAAVVGKRMMTERLIQSGRTNIVEHHRSSAWAEREYVGMYNMMEAGAVLMKVSIADVLQRTNTFSMVP